MVSILPVLQIVFAILLMAGVLLQRSEAGLGSAFGNDSGAGTRYTRRGMEKVLFHGTIIVGILFTAATFASLLLR